MPKDAYEMNESEIRSRIVTLAFGGDERLFIAFYRKLQQGLPEGTGIVLRGSVVTNKRHEDGTPFDSQGKATSDLDVTLVGSKVMEAWNSDAYYIPGLHTKPLGDKDPDSAPSLNPLRESLQKLVGRPVNFQATSSLVLYGRDVLFGEPYYVVVPPGEEA
ncbi:MAG TPA: hypothetical protein VJ751_05905 [Pyrinomonadaceae bacterium]|jgi:hypothetical protein|nr:hypothetical protein [Pyrinomonadaceae bacterium]